MAEGLGQLAARRWWPALGGARLDWTLALVAMAIGVLGYLVGDRTDWTAGFGYDGRLYGELAKNFPSAVFGDGGVIPPGLGHYDGPHLDGLDSYYAYRIVPSGIVWLLLEALDIGATNANIVGGFAALNAAMFGLATFCWCRSAGLLGLGDWAKLLGAIGLIVNFAVLKSHTYYPVLTDSTALGLGALSLYLWLRGSTVWLMLCVVLASFTWPSHLAIGALLLLFPAPRDLQVFATADPNDSPSASWRPAPFGLGVGLAAGLGALGALLVFELQGYQRIAGADQLPLFPLSAAVTATYVFAVVAFLLPRGGLRDLLAILRSIRFRNLALAVGMVVTVVGVGSLLADRESFVTPELTKVAFWSSTLDPGLFLVVLICYFGPLLLFLYADLPRVAADAWRLGPAIVGILGLGLLGALLTQPRVITNTVPFLVLGGVLAARRIYPQTRGAILAFLGLSLLLSRVWFPIGSLGFDVTKLQEFPAQRYFMATGTWTSPSMYALQLGVLAIIVLFLWIVARPNRGSGLGPPQLGRAASTRDPLSG